MCGILGTINLDFNNSILDLIARRGPDDVGLERFNYLDNTIVFGHRRLSIVDLSPAGHQPMTTEDGRYSIIFNGEVYNHAEIRAGLKQSVFRGHSDTETILYTLAEQGIEAVEKFNGIFGFCFYDHLEGKLFLVRDPFGVKPIYYSQTEKRLCFSSEIRPIRDLLPDEVSVKNLATLLRLRYLPAPLTIYSNINKLRPGHYLAIDLNSEGLLVNELPYFNQNNNVNGLPFDEALEEYGKYFDGAIKRQLMSDVEIGVMLSGGVDSALVAAKAQAFSNKPLKAFTVGFSEDALEDEIEDAAETARLLGMEHHIVRISDDDFFSTLENCVQIVEEPLATTSLIPMHYLSKLAASHVKVVLTGQGADEPLGGYRRYQSELLAPYTPKALSSVARKSFDIFGVKNQTLLRGASALRESDDILRFMLAYEVFSRKEIGQLVGVREKRSLKLIEYMYEFLKCSQRTTSAERMMLLDSRMNLADDLLLYTDKITMWQSIECRVPILDLQLVQFIESLPLAYKTRFLQSKIIHKQYAKHALPSKIVNRKKKGFQSPTKKWFNNERMVKERLLDTSGKFSTFFDLKSVETIISQHKKGFNRERHIFLLLAIKAVLEN